MGLSVERVNGKELSYDEFVERFMAKNEPVILSGLMEDWRACRDWVLEDGKPNLQFLSTNFGMNFYDFFIFVVCVSYVNMVQLYHLARRNSCKMWSSSQRAWHIILNLQSLKSIALKMKSTCLAKNDTVSTDIVKASEDPTILELCTRLERTYVIIHNKCEVSNETEDNLADGSGDMGLCGLSSSLIKTPQDLVSFIDCSLLNLGIFPPKKPMVSGID